MHFMCREIHLSKVSLYQSASKDNTIRFAATVSSCLLAKRIPRNCDLTSGKTRKSIGAKSGL
ncbi:hypothetical protein DPMN_004158 [Dreissena polymorpha]|uniref:Uncharacterized protein n=1 Tax=Dreissena polymorpha TaxID=45954 RepID=A0A9D4BWT4_DREPO|nr:hypothetical protein DPMN_072359 [Dreissena polymorpha]KAH3741527.1 hypothetical protein DPMN_048252 [Dreissena polymorpha]KAH3880248.1 hypothetical protein DPMN_004158 [Dreissena polymorpha]